jgi:hypothetical protein
MAPTTVPGAEKKRRLRLPKPPGESTGGKAGRPKGKTAEKPAYKSSAKPVETKPRRENLTYGDWLEVLDWKKSHPAMSQGDIVRHFATREQRQLVFKQPALSKALGREAEIRARVEENPSALSSKRPRIVTRPDVERALAKWVRSMNQRSEIVSGPMLVVKRARFEELLDVPPDERLGGGSGWVQSFCRT